MANVRPFVDWRTTNVEITLGGLGLFAALMSQLISVISRSTGLTFCAGCGEPYTFTWRKRDDRRHYCSKCGRQAADRDAHKRARAKQRVLRLAAAGVPIGEIIEKVASDRDTVQRWLRTRDGKVR